MAVDSTDGCLPSKQAVQAGEMEDSQASCQPSQSQDLNSQLNTQPATQPLDSSLDLDSSSQTGEECSWGQLYPHCGTFPRYRGLIRQLLTLLIQFTSCIVPLNSMPMHRKGPMSVLVRFRENSCFSFFFISVQATAAEGHLPAWAR